MEDINPRTGVEAALGARMRYARGYLTFRAYEVGVEHIVTCLPSGVEAFV